MQYLCSGIDRREDAGLFLGVVKAPAHCFFIKLVAASECDDEEKQLAIQWFSELTDELMAKIRAHEYDRSMDLPS